VHHPPIAQPKSSLFPQIVVPARTGDWSNLPSDYSHFQRNRSLRSAYTEATEPLIMGGQISKMMGKIFGSKEMRLLMLGLDAAGKTSELLLT
jgi:hypothetical protein